MHTEVLLAAAASLVSVGTIVRMVMRKVTQIMLERQLKSYIRAAQSERNKLDTLTVTNMATNASVQLPPHYDRQAVSRFLEITA